MKISQMPVSRRSRIGWRRPSQSLKSPTTVTRRAFGAQTAKCTPVGALVRDRVRAQLVEEPEVACPRAM